MNYWTKLILGSLAISVISTGLQHFTGIHWIVFNIPLSMAFGMFIL